MCADKMCYETIDQTKVSNGFYTVKKILGNK